MKDISSSMAKADWSLMGQSALADWIINVVKTAAIAGWRWRRYVNELMTMHNYAVQLAQHKEIYVIYLETYRNLAGGSL